MAKNKESGFPFTLDKKLCKKCGVCVSLCPREVFTAGPGGEPVVAYPERCSRCALCFYRCPDFAIQLVENQELQEPQKPQECPA